ncbi:hypothetical protein CXB51_028339 [Gossypium anomalum]|uniref:Uncharacterized protein n=1 Tax=Gossypium anomalum TaxID=47600 RepID=A0A8J5YCE4_9ROSI|nr:hypothetical protein CXB51_028339 [Gossypium anomalum]
MVSLQPKTMRRTGFHVLPRTRQDLLLSCCHFGGTKTCFFQGCDPFAMRGEKNKADKIPILPLEKPAKTLRLPMAVLFISMGFVTKNKT